MARDFAKASSHILSRDTSGPISAYPYTFFAQVYPKNTTSNETFMALGSDTSEDPAGFVSLGTGGASVARIQIRQDGGGQMTDNSVATLNQNAWNTLSVSFFGSADYRMYINGTKELFTIPISMPTSIVYTAIGGRRMNTTPSNDNFLQGRVGEAAIWDDVLTDDDHASLAAWYSPSLVRPEILVRHWQLIGRTSPEIELMGGFDLTVTGAVAARHPPIILPVKPTLVFVPAAANAISDYRFRQRFFG